MWLHAAFVLQSSLEDDSMFFSPVEDNVEVMNSTINI